MRPSCRYVYKRPKHGHELGEVKTTAASWVEGLRDAFSSTVGAVNKTAFLKSHRIHFPTQRSFHCPRGGQPGSPQVGGRVPASLCPGAAPTWKEPQPEDAREGRGQGRGRSIDRTWAGSIRPEACSPFEHGTEARGEKLLAPGPQQLASSSRVPAVM